MDCESGAAEACHRGATQGTHLKHASSWTFYLEFLTRIRHDDDPYLEKLDPLHRLCIFGAFLHAQQGGDLGSSRFAKQVIVGTAKETINPVAAAFVSNHRPDFIADSRRHTHIHIKRQIKGYRQLDPPMKHQKALPPIVFRQIINQSYHPRAQAHAQLLSGALFFAMRSCEYLFVGHGDRRTRPVQVQDIVFMVGLTAIHHNQPDLHRAEHVTINFGDQKSEIKFKMVTQYNNNDHQLNPVANWAHTVQRIRSYPGFESSWEVFCYHDGSKILRITASEVIIEIKAAVVLIGADVLGFGSDDVGIHSVRSSLAMLMTLPKNPSTPSCLSDAGNQTLS